MKKGTNLAVVTALLKAHLGQWMIRAQARGTGIARKDLGRFEEYLRFSLGVEKPAYVNPLQQPRNYFPGLTARPWHNPADFEWTAILEENWQRIKREALALPEEVFRAERSGLNMNGPWNEYFLYAHGRPLKENCRVCPETAEIVGSISDLAGSGEVFFSIIGPGTHILPHVGVTNSRLRCQLALQVPPGSRIRVGTETRFWQEGHCILFDDSFDHEVWNGPRGTRVVLIMDVWHPELRAAEKWAIDRLLGMSPQARRFRKYLEGSLKTRQKQAFEGLQKSQL